MADEALQENGENAEVNETEQVTEGAENPEQEAPPSVEDIASRMGWVPKEKFKGDEAKWKPAHDFIIAGKDIQERQSRDLKDLRTTMENVAKTTGAIMAERLETQKRELLAAHARAVEEGDPEAARQIARKIDQVEATDKPKPSPDSEAWVAKNPWFLEDPLAHARAQEVAAIYARSGKSPAEQLEAAEAAVRREYPHLFKDASQDKAPASVNAPASRTAETQKRGTASGDLPKEAKSIAQDLLDRGLIKSVDDYAKHYFAEQARKAAR
jgi:hypothetical protein